MYSTDLTPSSLKIWLHYKVVLSQSNAHHLARKKINSIALKQLDHRGLNNKLKTTQSVFNISSFIQVVGVLL